MYISLNFCLIFLFKILLPLLSVLFFRWVCSSMYHSVIIAPKVNFFWPCTSEILIYNFHSYHLVFYIFQLSRQHHCLHVPRSYSSSNFLFITHLSFSNLSPEVRMWDYSGFLLLRSSIIQLILKTSSQIFNAAILLSSASYANVVNSFSRL